MWITWQKIILLIRRNRDINCEQKNLFKNNISKLLYYNKYNNINKIEKIKTPLFINKQKRYISPNSNPNNDENKKIIYKRIYDNNNEAFNKKLSNKINNKTLSNFYKNNFHDRSDNNTNNINKYNKKLNIKIPNLNLRETRYDLIKNEKKYLSNLSNSKNYGRFDTSSHCDKDKEYIKYLFKLYQPNKKFKSFLYNLSNLKPKK